MKIRSLMTMMLAAVAFVLSMSSCSSNDDEPEVAVADQVVGSYTGTEVLTVMGEADESTETFEFTKSTDSSVDLIIPKYGEGMMTVPALPVKGIMLTQSGKGCQEEQEGDERLIVGKICAVRESSPPRAEGRMLHKWT